MWLSSQLMRSASLGHPLRTTQTYVTPVLKPMGRFPMTLASFGSSPNCQRYSGNFWAAHLHFLQQMNMHNELSLVFDPFWPLLARTLQQDKQSQPEQCLANIFALGSQEELFVQRPTAGLIISDCRGQGKQRELSYKGPIIYRPRAWVHMATVWDAEASPCSCLYLLIAREDCAKPLQSNNVIVVTKPFFSTLITSHVSLNKPKTLQGAKWIFNRWKLCTKCVLLLLLRSFLCGLSKQYDFHSQ